LPPPPPTETTAPATARKQQQRQEEEEEEEEETVRFFVTRLKMSKFKVGDIVWVKLRSYPWWPAEVFDPDNPDLSKEVRREQKRGCLLVRFYGEHNFSWVRPKANVMLPFRGDYFKEKARPATGGLQEALEEALEEEKRQGGPPPGWESQSHNAASAPDHAGPRKAPRGGEGKQKRKREEEEEDGEEDGEEDEGEAGEEEAKETNGQKAKSGRRRLKKLKHRRSSDSGDSERKNGGEKEEGEAQREEERKVRKRKAEAGRASKEERRKKGKREKKEKEDKQNQKREREKKPMGEAELHKRLAVLHSELKKAAIGGSAPLVVKIIKRIKRMPLNLELLHQTGIGRTVKRLSKLPNKEIAEPSAGLLKHLVSVMDTALAQRSALQDLQQKAAPSQEVGNSQAAHQMPKEPKALNKAPGANGSGSAALGSSSSTDVKQPAEANASPTDAASSHTTPGSASPKVKSNEPGDVPSEHKSARSPAAAHPHTPEKQQQERSDSVSHRDREPRTFKKKTEEWAEKAIAMGGNNSNNTASKGGGGEDKGERGKALKGGR